MRRWFWLLAVFAGVAVGIGAAAIGNVPHQVACDGNHGLAAILRFELATSPADVAALFGSGQCMRLLTAAMDAVNRIDSAAFIPAFTVFQVTAALALRGYHAGHAGSRLLALAVINMALVAGGLDMMENFRLFAIGWTVQAGNPVSSAAVEPLFWVVRAKFALLALAAGGLGVLVSRLGGRTMMVAGVAIIAGAACALAGVMAHALLTPGIAAAWIMMWLVAIAQTIRPAPSATAPSPPAPSGVTAPNKS